MPASLMQGILTGRRPDHGLQPAPGPIPDPLIREAVRLPAGQEMRAAVPVPEV